MQVEVDEVYMCTKFGRCSLSNFEDFAPFVWLQKRPNFPLESAQKFMQVKVHVACMHTNFGGHGLSSFRDFFLFCVSSIPLTIHPYILKV